MHDHPKRVARGRGTGPGSTSRNPDRSGPGGGGQVHRGERERAAKARGSLSRTREWSTVSIASKMRTKKCPLDLATLRSSVTFVGAVFVERCGGSQIGGGEE